MTPTKAAFERMLAMITQCSGDAYCSISETFGGWHDGVSAHGIGASIIHNGAHFSVHNHKHADEAADAVIAKWLKGDETK